MPGPAIVWELREVGKNEVLDLFYSPSLDAGEKTLHIKGFSRQGMFFWTHPRGFTLTGQSVTSVNTIELKDYI